MRISVSIPEALVAGEDGAKATSGSRLDVADAAYHTAHSYPGGVAALAVRMDMSANTLMHKVSLNNTTHHLTLREAVTMQEVTGNMAVLQAMASSLGYNCVRSLPASTDDTVALQWHMQAALADLQHAIADAFLHGATRNSVRRCDDHAADAISAINNLLGALRSQLPTAPKTHND